MTTSSRPLPSPTVTPENRAFFAAARENNLLLKGCDDCGRDHWYPRSVCPHCFSSQTRWRPASGRATVYSFSPMRRVDAPYTIAYVTLEEGPTMLTHLVGAEPDAWRIGQPVQVRFVPTDDGTPVPCFGPASA